MLLLLSHISRVQLCAIPQMAGSSVPGILQARILEWVAIAFSNTRMLSGFSRVWLFNPMDSSPPGSPVHGILQARILEWVAIAFSNQLCKFSKYLPPMYHFPRKFLNCMFHQNKREKRKRNLGIEPQKKLRHIPRIIILGGAQLAVILKS